MADTPSTARPPRSAAAAFPVTTAYELPGVAVERNLGITFGLVVRSMGFSKTVTGGISSLRQGEVPQFTMVLEDARRPAIDRMIENAKLLGANAVIATRFDLRHRVGVVLAASGAEQATAALADLPPARVPDLPGAGRRRSPGAGRGGATLLRHLTAYWLVVIT